MQPQILPTSQKHSSQNFSDPIQTAICLGNWKLVSEILKFNPEALKGSIFSKAPDIQCYEPKTAIKYTIVPQHEVLILEILHNFASIIPSNFVVHLIINRIKVSRLDFVKEILTKYPYANLEHFIERDVFYKTNFGLDFYKIVFKYMKDNFYASVIQNMHNFIMISGHFKSRDFFEMVLDLPSNEGVGPVIQRLRNESDFLNSSDVENSTNIEQLFARILKFSDEILQPHAQDLLDISGRYGDIPLMLEVFKRFPKVDLNSFFHVEMNHLKTLLQYAEKLDFVRQVYKDNIHYLLKWCANSTVLVGDEPIEPSLNNLKKILELYPDCDLKDYTDIVFKIYSRKNQPGIKGAFLQLFSVLLEHAKARQDDEYLKLNESRIRQALDSKKVDCIYTQIT